METCVGKRIQLIRKEKGILARDMAQTLGISRPYYTQLEGGRRRLSADHLALIARSLGVPVAELYGSTALPLASEIPDRTPSVDASELEKRLEPVMGKQTNEVVDCIQMWISAPVELKLALKAFHEARGTL